MLISDLSSDVCSSDLLSPHFVHHAHDVVERIAVAVHVEHLADPAQTAGGRRGAAAHRAAEDIAEHTAQTADRKSVVQGKSVSVRVDLGGRRIIKKKQTL